MKRISKLMLFFILIFMTNVVAYDGFFSVPPEFLDAEPGTCGNAICEPKDCPEDCNNADEMVLLADDDSIKMAIEIRAGTSSLSKTYLVVGGAILFALIIVLVFFFAIKKKEFLRPRHKFRVKFKHK